MNNSARGIPPILREETPAPDARGLKLDIRHARAFTFPEELPAMEQASASFLPAAVVELFRKT